MPPAAINVGHRHPVNLAPFQFLKKGTHSLLNFAARMTCTQVPGTRVFELRLMIGHIRWDLDKRGSIQPERKETMAKTRAKSKAKPARQKGTNSYSLVQGSNGGLYLISTKDKPRRLNQNQKKCVEKALYKFEIELSDCVGITWGGGGPGVHVVTTNVFPH